MRTWRVSNGRNFALSALLFTVGVAALAAAPGVARADQTWCDVQVGGLAPDSDGAASDNMYRLFVQSSVSQPVVAVRLGVLDRAKEYTLDVPVSDLPTQNGERLWYSPTAITFAHPVHVLAAWIDSAAVVGGKTVTCYPFAAVPLLKKPDDQFAGPIWQRLHEPAQERALEKSEGIPFINADHCRDEYADASAYDVVVPSASGMGLGQLGSSVAVALVHVGILPSGKVEFAKIVRSTGSRRSIARRSTPQGRPSTRPVKCSVCRSRESTSFEVSLAEAVSDRPPSDLGRTALQ